MKSAANIFFFRLRRALTGDEGTAAVAFILTFPLFLMIVGVLVQLALMENARLMVASAADAAARAAMTSLPEAHPENVAKAAILSLAPLSPQSADDSSEDGATYASALSNLGVDVPETFAARYSFAAAATQVSWTPQELDYTTSKGVEAEVTVNYQFLLSVPIAQKLISATQTSVGGVSGYYWQVSGKSKFQSSHSRKSATDGNGWPQ